MTSLPPEQTRLLLEAAKLVGSYKSVEKLLDAAVGNASFIGDTPVLALRRSQLLAGGTRAIDKELLRQLLPSLVKVARPRDTQM